MPMQDILRVAGIVVLGMAVEGSGQQPSPPEPPRPAAAPQPQPDVAAGDAAFQDQDWAAAIEAYQRALAAGQGHSLLHFRLGYALHVTGRHEEALSHHVQAVHITLPALRIDALYNAACACALLGRTDEAIAWLERAVDAGFQDLTQVGRDTDLDSLRADPRFKSIVEGLGKAPRLHQWMDFFLGDWIATGADGAARPSLKIERPLEGSHTLLSTSVQPRPPQPGVPAARWAGVLYPDADTRRWVWSYADGMGTRMEFNGERADKGGMRFTGRQYSPAGAGIHIRLTFTPREDGSVAETAEVSDDGQAWRTHHESSYRPRRADEPAAGGP